MADFWSYVLWAILLVVQNACFTYVSRARNSGSLKRHVIAAQMSNGVWFLGQFMVLSKMMDMLSGKAGMPQCVLTLLFYTAFTTLGSVASHYWALKTEKGKSAVGANSRFAQIRVEEWESVLKYMQENAALWKIHMKGE